MRTHVLQTYVHRIYDKSDAVTTFVTVMNYQICDAHSAASYMCIFRVKIYVQLILLHFEDFAGGNVDSSLRQ